MDEFTINIESENVDLQNYKTQDTVTMFYGGDGGELNHCLNSTKGKKDNLLFKIQVI